jgi:hypothetical protein
MKLNITISFLIAALFSTGAFASGELNQPENIRLIDHLKNNFITVAERLNDVSTSNDIRKTCYRIGLLDSAYTNLLTTNFDLSINNINSNLTHEKMLDVNGLVESLKGFCGEEANFPKTTVSNASDLQNVIDQIRDQLKDLRSRLSFKEHIPSNIE